MRPDWSGRHASSVHIIQFFDYAHLAEGPLRDIAYECAAHADLMLTMLGDGPELSAGMRYLLIAKDCFVRAALSTPVHRNDLLHVGPILTDPGLPQNEDSGGVA